MFDLSDLADVKPSALSFLTVGIMAVIFIILFKYLVNTYDNPVTAFFRDTANAV